MPFAEDWEENDRLPSELYQKAARAGLLLPLMSGARIAETWRYPILGGVDPSTWDGFHDFILHDELCRVGGIGVVNGLVGGYVRLYCAVNLLM